MEIAFRICRSTEMRINTASTTATPIMAVRYTSPPIVARSRPHLTPMIVIPVAENRSAVRAGLREPNSFRHDGPVPMLRTAALNVPEAMIRFAHAKL